MKTAHYFCITGSGRTRAIVLSFSVLLLLACSGKSSEQSATQAENDIGIPSIKLSDLNNQTIDLNQYKGKTVFINFWATWCGPCVKEIPSIERAKDILKDSKIEFLIASSESVEQIQSFKTDRNIDLHYVRVDNMEELGIQALPTTYIINSDGKLVFSETGYRQWDEASNIELLNTISATHE